ncbi:MAG: 1-deoxy-D-xylulose-5-phosphate synthase N-terminal domain-containing protein [Candidatus Magasanikbacteria bacterium]|nr:1-deoxy-D-xylulose-5-phosphate synthase N-terminal domain-containing protein [Candidatus Magasanikbacteria bacterium]
MAYQFDNISKIKDLFIEQPERFFVARGGGSYLNLKGLSLEKVPGFDEEKIKKYARIIRALIFSTIESSQSGHPGGSSSKVEQFLAITLSGLLSFDPLTPKNVGRDRVVWSAGHCTPLLYAGQSLYYEVLRRTGRQFSQAVLKNIFPEDLPVFRKIDGPAGHAESNTPYNDFTSGPSGHGFCAAGGMAISHKSCGLSTNVFVFMGDAESEEGMTFEARNVLASTSTDNIIVTLDNNSFGIDGPISEVISSLYLDQWLSFNWNVIEVDGHNLMELVTAYKMAKEKVFANNLPTVVIAHTIKGKDYGNLENSEKSHGKPLSHEEYVKAVQKLGFDIKGENNVFSNIEKILGELNEEDEKYILKVLDMGAKKIEVESKLLEIMKKKMPERPMISAMHLKRPKKLPPELVFKKGDQISTRQVFGIWLKWLMQNSGFVYAGAGDLSNSVMTAEAEKIYGLINKNNQFGRGIRFGIAENNMVMMMAGLSCDILPGGFRPVSVFGTYGVFLNMATNSIRLATINNHVHPEMAGFFIAVSSHDGPDTGEDGPTHQGLNNLSVFKTMPGIKVYKPNDANETIAMLFHALEIGEPIVLSLARPSFLVNEKISLKLDKVNFGAYIYKDFEAESDKKIILAVSGMRNIMSIEEIVPKLKKDGYAVKIVAVTSPELFIETEQKNPEIAEKIISSEEKDLVITINNGYSEFLSDFAAGENLHERMIGIDNYLKSGTPEEVYDYAELSPNKLYKRIKNIVINNI